MGTERKGDIIIQKDQHGYVVGIGFWNEERGAYTDEVGTLDESVGPGIFTYSYIEFFELRILLNKIFF